MRAHEGNRRFVDDEVNNHMYMMKFKKRNLFVSKRKKWKNQIS